MQRRQYLELLGATTVAGAAGCLSSGTSTQPTSTDTQTPTATLDVSDSNINKIDEKVTYRSVQVNVWLVDFKNSIKYNNPEKGTMETWDSGENQVFVRADISANNLERDDKPFPRWDSWELVTPTGAAQPIIETPDGTSVSEMKNVYNPQNTGVQANVETGWAALFNSPEYPRDQLAFKWTPPSGDPYYWGWPDGGQ